MADKNEEAEWQADVTYIRNGVKHSFNTHTFSGRFHLLIIHGGGDREESLTLGFKSEQLEPKQYDDIDLATLERVVLNPTVFDSFGEKPSGKISYTIEQVDGSNVTFIGKITNAKISKGNETIEFSMECESNLPPK